LPGKVNHRWLHETFASEKAGAGFNDIDFTYKSGFVGPFVDF
jgi:hypothetical protein